jgi:hypothetical protein
MQSHSLSSTIRVLFAAAVALYALHTLFNLSTVAFKAKQSASWPRVEGIIINSAAKIGCGKRGNSFYPDIKYEYIVSSGGTYTSNNVVFGYEPCGSEQEAAQFAKKFPLGATIPWEVIVALSIISFAGFITVFNYVRKES